MCNQIYSINRFIAHDSCINFMYQVASSICVFMSSARIQIFSIQ